MNYIERKFSTPGPDYGLILILKGRQNAEPVNKTRKYKDMKNEKLNKVIDLTIEINALNYELEFQKDSKSDAFFTNEFLANFNIIKEGKILRTLGNTCKVYTEDNSGYINLSIKHYKMLLNARLRECRGFRKLLNVA